MLSTWKGLFIGCACAWACACKATPAPTRTTSAPPKCRKLAIHPARIDAGATPDALPRATAPEVVGVLAGPGAAHPQPDLRFYGTDLGLTYEHDGKLVIMFGDTWMTPLFVCDEPDPTNDDTMATLPLSYPGDVPELSFVTSPSSPSDPARIHLLRGSTSLGLGSAKVPMTGFDDGERELAIFARYEPTRCGPGPVAGAGVCPLDDGFVCTTGVGQCTPPYRSVPYECDAKTKSGCFPGQSCAPVASRFCVDANSPERDGSIAGEIWSLAQDNEIGVRRPGLTVYDSVFVWPTNKFVNLTARTVKTWSGMREGSAYEPGNGALLVWGRPGFVSEDGRQARLFLMAHRLPFAIDTDAGLQFEPQYFAGLDPSTGEPIWSELQSQAAPLALDGVENGDPDESEPIANQMSVSWLGPPIEKWVMLYGGDSGDDLLYDPTCTRASGFTGAIMLRFADYPWGPWSPARPHLLPGSPHRIGDAYGPGGIMFHPDCIDKDGSHCRAPDPQSTANAFVPGCVGPPKSPDLGRLYAPAIIDSYTAPNGDDGLDVFWNVSTLNPYQVVLIKTTIRTQ
jgi:hypothetical protein